MESEGSNMPEPEKTPAPSEQTSKLGIFARLRAYFFAGVLVTAPIAITIALAVWIIGYIDDQIVPLIPQRYNPDTYFQQYLGVDFGLPGLGVLVLILAITLIGAFTAGLDRPIWRKAVGPDADHPQPVQADQADLSNRFTEPIQCFPAGGSGRISTTGFVGDCFCHSRDPR